MGEVTHEEAERYHAIGQDVLLAVAGQRSDLVMMGMADAYACLIGGNAFLRGGSPGDALALLDEIRDRMARHITEHWGTIEVMHNG